MHHNLITTIAKYSIQEAVRDKFLIFIFLGILGFFCISLFIGELAITEMAQTQSAILGSILRFFSVFSISLFVITSMIREFDDKGFELILSHPVPRSSYYFGKFAGFSVIAFIVVVISLCCLFIYTPIDRVLFWSLSLFCELLIIISLSLLCLFSFNNIPVAFSAVMAFYYLSRTIEAIQLISDSPVIASASLSHKFINIVLDIIAYIVPDLYKFTQTEWLIYQLDSSMEIFTIIGQTLIYISLLSCAALFDLYRKEL